ncbi:aminotransferase class III-fold pyridoxal phosphate-dependent enzyme [Micromonospora craniellae]|uniref:aminotransferase class III-fold pyridoxal phosphate-dependent enzyme n=1 Tax=Micromonospora craniellae TaxID=2294034 RepID=UPI0013147D07|nr:aminotransferase class III-fold pyridoxal phosphate-dependent enzyme [Micromonospora craniellae]QOC93917.1 aminotransferase class III-fold pyridoxal phosphate-dependent enzyme [Micromonospora craniellae]
MNYNFRIPGHEHDLVVAGGEGAWITTTSGLRMLDFFSAFGARAFPHGCRPYEVAVATGARVMSGSLPSAAIEHAAATLIRLFPHHSTVRFCTSGTEAVQLAIRLARAATGRTRIMRFNEHYHGHLDALLGGTYSPSTYPDPAVLPDDPRATEGSPPEQVTTQNYLARWNNIDDVDSFFRAYGDSVAAVLLEPYPINAGAVAPAPGFLERIRQHCNRHNAVLIFDEIITGIRAGFGGWQATSSVRPDITLLGKMLGGGAVPVSAVLTSDAIFRLCADHRVVHGGTLNGSPLAAAAITRTIELLQAPGALSMDSLHRAGKDLLTSIHNHIQREDLKVIVTGLPAAFWIKPIGRPISARTALLRRHLLAAGVLPAAPTRIYTTAGMTENDIAEGAQRILTALRAFSQNPYAETSGGTRART